MPRTHLRVQKHSRSFGVYSLAFVIVGFSAAKLADQLRLADQSLLEKEQGLSRLRAFHENIVHSISSGVFTADEGGRITSFNPAAQEATGYSLDKSTDDIGGRCLTGIQANHLTNSLDRYSPTCELKWNANERMAVDSSLG